MNAMQTQDRYPIEVRAEARRIADRSGGFYVDLSKLEAFLAVFFFRQAIKPLQDMKVLAYSMATIGRVSVTFVEGADVVPDVRPLPPEIVETLRGIDAEIAAEARRFGAPIPEFPEYQTIGADDGSD